MRRCDLISRLLAEAVATFCYVFLTAGAAVVAVNIAHGAYGPVEVAGVAVVSGACFTLLTASALPFGAGFMSPALAAAFCTAGDFGLRRWSYLALAELGGGALAATLLGVAAPSETVRLVAFGAPTAAVPLGPAVLVQLAGSGLLALVALTVKRGLGPATRRSGSYPVVVGAALVLLLVALTPLVGAGLNPAASLGAGALAHRLSAEYLLTFAVAPVVGSAAVGMVFWTRNKISRSHA